MIAFSKQVACAIATIALIGSAHAQSFEELDRLSDATTSEQAAIALANEQSENGEYLEALATLERLLAIEPKSREALLMHAVLLCTIDDKQGGRVELKRLKKKEFADGLLEQAYAFCEGSVSND